MKRCPQCNRFESDDSLSFCRVDGAPLANDSSALDDEVGTVRLSPLSTEAATTVLPNPTNDSVPRGTGPTTVLTPNSATATGAITKPRSRKAIIGVVVLVTAVIAVVSAVVVNSYRSKTRQAPIESIAVMPFINDSGNADVEYLSDGMTETLISSLSQLPNLNVKPRSSVFRYKGKETTAQTIAKELSVEAVLNGRLEQRGEDVSLFVELIDSALDKVVWSQRYSRKQTDLVSLQTEVARDIASRLKSKLSGADEAKVTKTYTTNPDAYQLYLRGNFYQSKYTEEGFKKAIEYYEKAIAIDPNYALAYHGVAVSYDFANGYYLSPNEAEPKAKAAAQKALELDETIADAHYFLGKILFWYDWDWARAEKEWARANELDHTYPSSYPVYLAAIGKFDEAIKAQQRVQQRTPLDLNANLDLAGILRLAGKYDECIQQSRKALELDPNFWWSYQELGLAYARKKEYREAIASLEKSSQLEVTPTTLGYLGYVYAVAGRKAEALKVLSDLQELSKHRYVSPYNIACIYVGLNDKDHAFDLLEQAYQERSFFMPLLKFETVLDNLHSDPRFNAILKRVNLPE